MRKQAEYNTELVCADYLSDLLTLPKIAIKHCISIQTVYDIVKRQGLSTKRQNNRKNIFNYHYFDTIDTPDKAYFLGWLYSDGNNYPENHSVQLKIKDSDIEILEVIRSYIADENYPIKIVKRKNENTQCNLIFSNIHFSNKCIEKGVFKDKTFTLKFPNEKQVPKHLQSHFIRGYFDGDGCILTSKNKNYNRLNYQFIISGNYEVLSGIQIILMNQLDFKQTKLIKNKNIFNMCYGGNKQVKKIYNWLYKDCNDLYLKRKKEKFETL